MKILCSDDVIMAIV